MIGNLSLIGELNNKSAYREGRLVSEGVIDGLGSHITREYTAVGGESGNGDADVIIDLEDLLLMRGELRVSLVHASQNHMALRSQPYRRRALLHSLHRVLHLE